MLVSGDLSQVRLFVGTPVRVQFVLRLSQPTVEACFRELRLFILWVPLRAKTVFRTQKDLKHWSDDRFWTASSIPLTPLSGFTHEI